MNCPECPDCRTVCSFETTCNANSLKSLLHMLSLKKKRRGKQNLNSDSHTSQNVFSIHFQSVICSLTVTFKYVMTHFF